MRYLKIILGALLIGASIVGAAQYFRTGNIVILIIAIVVVAIGIFLLISSRKNTKSKKLTLLSHYYLHKQAR